MAKNAKNAKKRSKIGGQAVIEGVMMKSPGHVALAVRLPDGTIATKVEECKSASKRNWFAKLPVVRGVVNFIEMMALGVRMIVASANMAGADADVSEPSRFEKFVAKKTGKSADGVMYTFSIILAVGLSVGLFILLPSFMAGLVSPPETSSFVFNLIEGGIRLAIFLGYISAVSLLRDMRRVYQYHGAEHKTINCVEHEEELTLENARRHTRLHPRCGTNYLLLVMVTTVLIFSLINIRDNLLLRLGSRVVLIPLVAGVAYEILKLAAKSDNIICRAVRSPGMMLQRLTTREPDDSMIEVAIAAYMGVSSADEAEKEAGEAANG